MGLDGDRLCLLGFALLLFCFAFFCFNQYLFFLLALILDRLGWLCFLLAVLLLLWVWSWGGWLDVWCFGLFERGGAFLFSRGSVF